MSAICVFKIKKVILSVGLTRCPRNGTCGVLPLGLLGQLAEADLVPGCRAKAKLEKVPPGEITVR